MKQRMCVKRMECHNRDVSIKKFCRSPPPGKEGSRIEKKK